jgi:hypothetical protein
MTYENVVTAVPHHNTYEDENVHSSRMNYLQFYCWCLRYCWSVEIFLSLRTCELEIPLLTQDDTAHTEVVFFRRASPFWKTVYLLGNPMNKDTELTEQQYFISISHSKEQLYVLGTGVFHCTSEREFCRCEYCLTKHTQLSSEFCDWIGQYL